ncbi:MAG: DapH/DapD/GlmU-related protein, partial [Vibrio sp.]
IYIDDGVFIGPSCQLYTASHSLDYQSRARWETVSLPIHIKKYAWIGGNSVINQGVTIGERAVIAAGSVVNCDVPDDCLYGGVPARFIRKIETQS